MPRLIDRTMLDERRTTTPRTPPRKREATLLENVKTIVYAVLIAIGIRTVAFEPFNIPSGSMIPTLLKGDYLFVSKYAYGYSKHSLPWSLPIFDGRIFGSQPQRGDVVVFKNKHQQNQDFIKRLVGLPGERIQIRGGVVHINGVPVKREPLETKRFVDDSNMVFSVTLLRETFPNGRSHIIQEVNPPGRLSNTREYVVPEGHFFFMGDNRDLSNDSRVLPEDGSLPVGFVPYDYLVGRADFLFFSIENASIWEIWKWPFAIRGNRIFKGIE